MKLHVIKRHIQQRWKKRWVRTSVTLVILGVVIYLQYVVSRLPQPQDVDEAKYTPAVSKASEQELVIRNPLLLSDSNVLLKFDGKKSETVEFRAARARLSPDTLSFLNNIVRGQKSAPPTGFVKIDYLIKDDQEVLRREPTTKLSDSHPSEQSADPSSTCLTFVAIRAIDKKMPTEVHFYQPEKGNQAFQALVVSAIGSDLEILIRQSQPNTSVPEGNPWAAGCRRNLVVGEDWGLENHGEFDLSIIVPASEAFRLDFHALGPTASLHSGGGLFEPLAVGEQSLKAKALNIITHDTKSAPSSKTPPPHLTVNGAGETGLLTINGLKEADDELHLSFSGVGLVELNGAPAKTLSFFDLINKYPIIASIFGVANAALGAWVIHSIFGKNSTT